MERPFAYQVRVWGELDESWSEWLDGMDVIHETDSDGSNITTLAGTDIDQAALHGILNRIRDLNLTLLSVQLI